MKSITNEIYQMIKEECSFELNQISELIKEQDKKIEQLEKALDKSCNFLAKTIECENCPLCFTIANCLSSNCLTSNGEYVCEQIDIWKEWSMKDE